MSNVSGDLYLANGGNDNAYHSRIRLMDGRAIYFDIEAEKLSLLLSPCPRRSGVISL